MFVQATVVYYHQKGFAFIGKSGSGKSSAALKLISHGGTLVADDGVDIVVENKVPYAICPTSIEGKIEVRGIGIVSTPFIKKTALHFVIECKDSFNDIQRYPEPQYWTLSETQIPLFTLCPFDVVFMEKIDLLATKF